jgi:cell wall-associated NlpC family hydrolase
VAEEPIVTQNRSGVLSRVRTTITLSIAGFAAASALAVGTAPADANAAHERQGESAAQPVASMHAYNTKRDRQQARREARQRRLAATRGRRVISLARSQAGKPYVYGAAGPNAYDCSGLTMWVYRHVHVNLPHNSAAQAGRTRRISRAAARPGDLVFFTDGGGVYHVAIYAGHNAVWHAPYSGERVRRERIWTSSVFFGRVR